MMPRRARECSSQGWVSVVGSVGRDGGRKGGMEGGRGGEEEVEEEEVEGGEAERCLAE